jgi:hypothetical protein
MTKLLKISLFILFLVSLSACSKSAEPSQGIAREQIIQRAVTYQAKDYENGAVPLHAMVKVSGKIIQTDGKDKTIAQKHDRFILEMATGRLQVFNNEEQSLQAGDQVDVYGEYYGIIQSSLIEVKHETEN